jgi:hypothetical protein
MFNWLARGVLIAAGFVVSWFMTKDSPQFGIMEMAVAVLLFMLLLAFWPASWTQILSRLHKPR